MAGPRDARATRCPRRAAGQVAAGSVTRATVPPPSRGSRSKLPPCSRATRSTIASPSPAPATPGAEVRAADARVNGCLSRATSAGGMPGTAIGDVEHEPIRADRGRHLDRRRAVGERVVDEVVDQARERGRAQRYGRHRAGREAHVPAGARVAVDARGDDRVGVRALQRHGLVAAGEIEELADDRGPFPRCRRSCRPSICASCVPISSPSRSRASGVRRSCDTPASSSARSCSSWRRLAIMRLKPRLSATISGRTRFGQRRRRLAATDALDRGVELAQRAREVAGEQERGERAARSPAPGSRPAPAWERRRRPVAAAAESRSSSRVPPASTRTNSSCRRGAIAQLGAGAERSRAAVPASSHHGRRPARARRPAAARLRARCARRTGGRCRAACRAAPGCRRRTSAARSACSWTILVSPNWRSSSAARSCRKNAIVATIAIATTAISSSVRRPNSDRGQSVTAPRGRRRRGRRAVRRRARRRPGRRRSRSPTRSGCSADWRDRARSACAGATPARRSRGRTGRGRGRARAASAFRAPAAGADAATNTFTSANSPVVRWIVALAVVRACAPRDRAANGPNAVLPAGAGAPGATRSVCRRSTAWMRATSSRGLNGLGR